MLAYPDPHLSDDVISLRPWQLTDLAPIAEASAEGRIPEGTTVPTIFTVAAGEAFVRRQWSRVHDGQALSLAITDVDDQALGLVFLALRPQPGVAGIGYWLAPSARGRRVATRAVSLLSDWALGIPGLYRVEAWVEAGNDASARTLLRAGFELEGRLRSFLSAGDRRFDADVFSRVRAASGSDEV